MRVCYDFRWFKMLSYWYVYYIMLVCKKCLGCFRNILNVRYICLEWYWGKFVEINEIKVSVEF